MASLEQPIVMVPIGMLFLPGFIVQNLSQSAYTTYSVHYLHTYTTKQRSKIFFQIKKGIFVSFLP